MPDGWLRESLGDLIVLEYGKGLKEDARDGGQYPVVSSAGVVGHHSHPLVESAPVIVVGRKGSAGTVHWSDAPCWPIDTTFWVRPVTERLDPEFLYLLLQHADLPAICAQTGVPGLSRDRAYEVRVDVPPLVVQRRVVDLVDAVDTYCSVAQVRHQAARTALTALLNDLLHQDRGSDWNLTRIGDIADVVGGGTPSTKVPEYWGGTIPWVTPSEVSAHEGAVISTTARTITPEGLAKSGARLLPPRSVLLTSRATVGAVAIAGVEMATNQGFASLVAGPEVIPEFLAKWCQHNRAEFEIRAGGSTFPEIPKSLVKDVPLLLPPLAVQRRVVDLATAAEHEVGAATTAEAAALSLRSALLGELLSGDRVIPESYDDLVGLVA